MGDDGIISMSSSTSLDKVLTLLDMVTFGEVAQVIAGFAGMPYYVIVQMATAAANAAR